MLACFPSCECMPGGCSSKTGRRCGFRTTEASIRVRCESPTLAFSAVLSRSKTIGVDKSIGSRPLTIAACCFLSVPAWLHTGFALLHHLAPFPRDYLLPSPASSLAGALTREMRYETGYGLQNRVFLQLEDEAQQLHITGTTQLWTPHSVRAFLQSATAMLGYEKSDRDFLADGPRREATGAPEYHARKSRTCRRL